MAQKILQISPWAEPNTAGTFNAAGPSGNLSYNPPSRTYFDDLNGRVDHQFNPNIKIYGSFTWNKNNGAGRPANIVVHDFDATNGNSIAPGQSELVDRSVVDHQSDSFQ